MSTNGAKDIQFFVNEKAGAVSGLLIKPSDCCAVCSVGAMARSACATIYGRLGGEAGAARGIATLRYQFPYMEKAHQTAGLEGVLTDTSTRRSYGG